MQIFETFFDTLSKKVEFVTHTVWMFDNQNVFNFDQK